MLQDLADARADAATPQRPPQRPPVSGGIPPNLPVAQRPVIPTAPAPRPISQTPAVQRPPINIAQPPRPTAPAPIPREIPVPSVPPPPRPPAPPAPAQQPIASTPPPAPKPVAPTAPAAPGQPYTTELRTMSGDIGRISTGQAPAGVPPSRPTPPPPPAKTPTAPAPVAPAAPAPIRATIVIPEGSGRGGKGKIFMIGSILLVLIVAAYVFVSRDSGTPETTPSPSASPSASATLNPATKSLRTYFGAPGITANIRDTASAQGDFKAALSTSQPPQKQASVISVQKDTTTMVSADFLSAMLPGAPTDLTSALASDWTALAFGQTEAFDGTGTSIQTTSTAPRLVLIFELSDASRASQALAAWQTGELAQSGQAVFGYDVSLAIVPTFSAGTYRQITVNYQNFPYADRSIDYAVMLASNGKNYLILSGSRQSMFFAIDQLMQ